ncbi:MAG: hypothetical protein RLZZ436_2716 [Planctomycetota bacterium]|jgi:hypothetical protein
MLRLPFVSLIFTAVLLVPCNSAASPPAQPRPRLAVLTDIGGDPDDQQSLIRLMLYTNELDLRLIMATAAGTPGELQKAVTREDLIQQIVNALGEVLPRLQHHAEGWPDATELQSRICSGNKYRGRDHIGAGHDTEGSRRLLEEIDAATPANPLNIAIWGGQTDFAQALWRIREDRGPEELAMLRRRFRVYDISDQDGLAEWLRVEFPGMLYILASTPEGRDRRDGIYRGMYLTGDLSTTSRQWVEEHIRSTGPLGKLYPTQTWTAPNPHSCLKEGDTPSWFFFLPRGGNDPADPTRPGWGGRFARQADGWYRDPPFLDDYDPRTEISRWRGDFQADFAKRMNWCREAQAPH